MGCGVGMPYQDHCGVEAFVLGSLLIGVHF
jgi:hypothetical protein